MDVGNSVRKSINDWEDGETDAAMLHACNALDGTAAKTHPVLGNADRFTRLLRDNYEVFGPMGAPGVNLRETRFPVKVKNPKAADGVPDIADVIYGIHRCHHGHGDTLPDGFALLEDAGGPPGSTHMSIAQGRVQLSDRVIFGLLAVAVLQPVNRGQKVPDGYILTLGQSALPINDWWGRADDFYEVAAKYPTPSVKLDFGGWMDGLR